MAVIFSTTDCRGNTVVLHTAAWEHICKRHPEVISFQDGMRQVIEHPHVIIQDKAGNCHYCRLRESGEGYAGSYLKVVVKSSKGFWCVATAFFVDYPGEGKVVWALKST